MLNWHISNKEQIVISNKKNNKAKQQDWLRLKKYWKMLVKEHKSLIQYILIKKLKNVFFG